MLWRAGPESGADLLYLVRETKARLDLEKLRPDEKRKILCGRSHFAAPWTWTTELVTEAAQLPDDGA